MGKYSNKIKNQHSRAIPESVWNQILSDETFTQSDLCSLDCPNVIALSKRSKHNNYSYNEGTCKLTGENIYAGSSLCVRNKESR